MLHYSEAKVRWEYSVVKARGRIGAVESLGALDMGSPMSLVDFVNVDFKIAQCFNTS